MELSVYKIDGTNSGKQVTLDERVFGITPHDHAIYLDVVQYLANQRQGTSKTKDRSENAHSTKKLGRQKGGGGARHGSLKSGIFVGGGTIHGPQPRCYWHKLNKKVKSLARCSALSYKAAENAITLKGIRLLNLGDGIVPQGSVQELLHDYGLDGEGIVRSALEICSDNGKTQ